MTTLGPIALLATLLAAAYACCASLAGVRRPHRGLLRSAAAAGWAGGAALSLAIVVLVLSLLAQDLHLRCVAESGAAPRTWYDAVAAVWAGQSATLLLWTWLLAAVALAHRSLAPAGTLSNGAFAVLMGWVAFLAATLLGAANPWEILATPMSCGNGVSADVLPHAPLALLSYAAWAIPFAVATSALGTGQLNDDWVRHARGWALLAWSTLGLTLLWDAGVTHGGGNPHASSYAAILGTGAGMVWLSGTAFIHCLLAWGRRGVLKKTALGLAIALFAACNLAVWCGSGGIVHGLLEGRNTRGEWMLLAALAALGIGAMALILARRSSLRPQQSLANPLSREALVLVATCALPLLSAAAWCSTAALIPLALAILAAAAAAPLLRWGDAPTRLQIWALSLSGVAGMLGIAGQYAWGVRQAAELAVGGLAGFASAVLLASLVLDVARIPDGNFAVRAFKSISARRRQYAGFAIHLSLFLAAIGRTALAGLVVAAATGVSLWPARRAKASRMEPPAPKGLARFARWNADVRAKGGRA